MAEVEVQTDRGIVLRERARLADEGAERRANPSELRFLDKIRDRALAEGDAFKMTAEQRANYSRIVRDVLDRTGWRPTRR
jgi:hypothetical protein